MFRPNWTPGRGYVTNNLLVTTHFIHVDVNSIRCYKQLIIYYSIWHMLMWTAHSVTNNLLLTAHLIHVDVNSIWCYKQLIIYYSIWHMLMWTAHSVTNNLLLTAHLIHVDVNSIRYYMQLIIINITNIIFGCFSTNLLSPDMCEYEWMTLSNQLFGYWLPINYSSISMIINNDLDKHIQAKTRQSNLFRHFFSTLKQLWRSCRNKFDCLVNEMLLIKHLRPCLNVQSDLIRAKVFV